MPLDRPDAASAGALSDGRRQHLSDGVWRFPLVVVMLAVAVGIVFDRYAPWSLTAYVAAGVTGFGFWGVARQTHRRELACWGLIVGFCSAGSLHHQLVLNAPAAAELQPLLSEEPLLVRLNGTAIDRPTLFVAPVPRWQGERPQQDLTRFDVDCSAVFRDGQWRPVSGAVQVDVSGAVEHVDTGDFVELSGWASVLPRPRNPGQFDARASLQSRGLCGVLRVENPGLIEIRQHSQSLRSSVRRFLRTRFEQTLRQGLSADNLPIAQAILLGDRALLSTGTRSLFVESGTMHLLAISGLHVGIVAMFLYGLARGLRFPPRVVTLIVLGILTLYIDAADARPPMIRAFVLIAIWSFGRLLNRPSFSANSLALAALVLLGTNPTTLFDVGAQLSFLAVATILWSVAIGRRRHDDWNVDVAVAPDSQRARDALRPNWQRWLLASLRSLRRPMAISVAIWLISAPLTAATFHVLAPIGIVLNIVLIPLTGVALCFGFSGLLIGIVSPGLAALPLTLFGGLLTLVVEIVDLASRFQLGHVYVASSPLWWLLGFYAITAAAMLLTAQRRRKAPCWSGVVLWLLFGLVLPRAEATERLGDLTCTVLSVGHGLSIIVETPNGRVLVYDCGAAGRPESAAVTLQRALLESGITRIDGLLVSHADADHFNGAESIAGKIPIGRLLLSRHFPDADQPGTLALINAADDRGIPLEFVQQGDRLQLDDAVAMQILHPAARDEFLSDNAASIVLQLEFGGRRILLTGDLEDDGLRSLLRQPRRDIDVLLAPHHGAIAASPPELAAWAAPRIVVASARRRFDAKQLEDRYGSDTDVLTTSQSGAIEIRVSPTGVIRTRRFLDSGQQDIPP